MIFSCNGEQVCWSDDGERFAGLGDGGVVATWRLDAPRLQASDTGYLGRSDWCHQVTPHPSSSLPHAAPVHDPPLLHTAACNTQTTHTQLDLMTAILSRY